jgi:hypothetical protein
MLLGFRFAGSQGFLVYGPALPLKPVGKPQLMKVNCSSNSRHTESGG